MDTSIIDTQTATRAAARRPLPALTRWTVATLAAICVMLIYLQVVVVGSFSPPLALILGLPAVVVAVAIIVSRRRWAPLLAVIYWILLMWLNVPHLSHDLAHPEFLNVFAFSVIVLALAGVGIVAGIGATVQNYRAHTATGIDAERMRLPRWFPALLWSLAGLCLGAILVATLLPTSASAGVSAESLATLPALGAVQIRFDQTELRVKAGEIVALRLENRDSQPHSFNIDEFKVHVSMPPGTPSLALFRPTTPGTYTFYCDVPTHRQAGMVGTLIVAP